MCRPFPSIHDNRRAVEKKMNRTALSGSSLCPVHDRRVIGDRLAAFSPVFYSSVTSCQ
ncbi:hypothetical protein HMPREF3033_00327 [Veillonellaceae bacterium DNF00751]|nr:hypothetical protein HMPREF3033_00327 [Veillonellaceae bacterium DNF00751]